MKFSVYLATVFVIIDFTVVSANEIPKPFPCLFIQYEDEPSEFTKEIANWSIARLAEKSNEYQGAEIRKIKDITTQMVRN